MLAGVAKLTIDNDCSPEDDDKGDDDEWVCCYCQGLNSGHRFWERETGTQKNIFL